MPVTSFYVSADALERLEAVKAARGLKNRSQAVRKLLEEASLELQEPSGASEVADREELLRIATVQARRGNMTAVKLLLEELRRDGDDEERPARSVIDELRGRREQRAA